MDPHLVRLERRLDTIDDVLRGDTTGSIGLAEAVRRITAEQQRQGGELAELRAVPAQLDAIRKESAERDGKIDRLTTKTEQLIAAATKENAMHDGEEAAMNRLSKWLKIAAVVLGLFGLGGGGVAISLLRSLSEVAGALP